VESSCECGNELSGSVKCCKLSSGFTTGDLSKELRRVSYFIRQLVSPQSRVFELCAS
jgi:hypothetical protein